MRLLRMGESGAARPGRATQAAAPAPTRPLLTAASAARAPELEVRDAVGAGRAELRDLEGLALCDHLLDQLGKKQQRSRDFGRLRLERLGRRNRAEHRFPPFL